MTTPTRAACYIRVSTDKQANEGVSLEAQQAKLRQYAALYDIEIAGMYIDAGLSACNLDRPALQGALASLGKTADALLVVKLDRLTRSVRDLCMLTDKYFRRYSLLSVAEQIDTRSASGRMVMNLLSVISQWEREAIGERTRAAKQWQKTQGHFVGGSAPYGYTITDAGLTPHPEEQLMIEDMKTRRQLGETVYSIARSVRTRKGTPMSPNQVRRLTTVDPVLTIGVR